LRGFLFYSFLELKTRTIFDSLFNRKNGFDNHDVHNLVITVIIKLLSDGLDFLSLKQKSHVSTPEDHEVDQLLVTQKVASANLVRGAFVIT
jgi:hypothetical protein